MPYIKTNDILLALFFWPLINSDINGIIHSLIFLSSFFFLKQPKMQLLQLPFELQLLIMNHIKKDNHLDLAPLAQ